jgi:hypothetical protein
MTELNGNLDYGSPTFLGDWTKYSKYVIASEGTEILIFFAVNIICVITLMNSFSGRPWRAEQFFVHIPIDILGAGAKNKCLIMYFRIIAWFYFVVAIVTPIFWGILVYSNAPPELSEEVTSQEDYVPRDFIQEHTAGGIGIILICISLGLGLLAFVKIRWNNWRFKRSNMW